MKFQAVYNIDIQVCISQHLVVAVPTITFHCCGIQIICVFFDITGGFFLIVSPCTVRPLDRHIN